MNVIVPCDENRRGRIETDTQLIPATAKPRKFKIFALLAACAALGLSHASAQTTNVYVNPTANWIGYMNVFNYPPDGNPPIFGSAWGTADLNAAFSGSVLTFTPNYSIDRDSGSDPFWWNPDGTPSKNMDANFYVEDGNLAGQTVTFSGYCWTNTLVDPYSTNTTAFIKDFAPDYSSFTGITTNLTGGFFSITLATTPGDHIQYGFEMVGPDARRSNSVANGSVIISSNTPPTGPVITAFPNNPSVLVSSNISLDASATGSSLNYQWYQNGVKLTNGANIFGATNSTLNLSNVTGAAEGDYSLIASNFTGSATNMTHLTVLTPNHLTLDPRAPWIGYMNVFALPQDGGAYQFGSSWAVKDLRAIINGGTFTLLPNTNTYNPSDAYWVNPDGSGAKSLDAVVYQQFDGLNGTVITFSGFCQSNTLDAGYTNTAFIKDFSSGYAVNSSAVTALVPGQPFSITLDMTANPAGDHIQWGFETVGPDANPATVASLGAVVVTINPPVIKASNSGNTVSLNVPTESGLNYAVQYTTNLSAPSWQTLSTVWGNGTNIVVTNAASAGARFYRTSAQ
jgi:hypothetical protein